MRRRARAAAASSFATGVLRWGLLFLCLWILVPVLVLRWQPVAIVGESMSPSVRAGDVVLIDQRMPPAQGSVVTFATADRGLITHRLMGFTPDGSLRLRGDANRAEDAPVASDDVVGVARLLVPVAATPVALAHHGNLVGAALAVLLATAVLLGRLPELMAGLRARMAVAGPAALVLLVVMVMVPSQAQVSGQTTNPGNRFTVIASPPAPPPPPPLGP